jgi:putative PIN family toxin of toxin-antitoxin system
VARVKAVLDTNVVVSAHLKERGLEALILELALSGRFDLVASPALLAEYEEVLRRPRFSFNPDAVSHSIEAIRDRALIVSPRRRLSVTRDPDDNMVLECASSGRADYVVTGNTRDFPQQFRGIYVVPPRHFVLVLAASVE